MPNAIISIHPEHVSDIVNGSKTVEIRTRPVSLEAGSRLWIYATLPIGEIQAVARVTEIHRISPTRAWLEFEDSIGLTRSDFRSYVNGNSLISVIRLGEVVQLAEPLSLQRIRRSHRGFQPPQFLKHLENGEGVYRLLLRLAPTMFK